MVWYAKCRASGISQSTESPYLCTIKMNYKNIVLINKVKRRFSV